MNPFIRALTVRSGIAKVETISADLMAMQAFVGGWVEHVRLWGPYAGLHMWVNEEGLLQGLPQYDCPLYPANPIAGDFFVSRIDAEGEPVSLRDADVELLATVFGAKPELGGAA